MYFQRFTFLPLSFDFQLQCIYRSCYSLYFQEQSLLYDLVHWYSYKFAVNIISSSSSFSTIQPLSCCLCVFFEQCGPHRSEEDSMLWHWCGGGWPTEGPNEQFFVLHNQPAGNCCSWDEGKACQSITDACNSLDFRRMGKKWEKS